MKVNKVELQELVGGELQKKFQNAFEKVINNMQDLDTPHDAKRGLTVKFTFAQNADRDVVAVTVDVSEKLAPQEKTNTAMFITRDPENGMIITEEIHDQIRGQMNIEDY